MTEQHLRMFSDAIGHVHHLYPLPLHQRQEAFQSATAWVHDELGQSADDQGGVCAIGAVN